MTASAKFWRWAGSLEAFKFSLYVSVPIFSSVFYANPAFMHDLIMRLQFVKYPEAAPKPPVGTEIESLRASRRAKKE